MKKFFTVMALLGASLMVYADDKPTFPGGQEALNKYIYDNTNYPEIAKENGVEGIVVIGFLVTTEGSIKDAKVLKFVDPDLEKEALRVVVGMPAWIPAQENGTPIEAPSKVDVPFILE